jgi:hypothetical protein
MGRRYRRTTKGYSTRLCPNLVLRGLRRVRFLSSKAEGAPVFESALLAGPRIKSVGHRETHLEIIQAYCPSRHTSEID